MYYPIPTILQNINKWTFTCADFAELWGVYLLLKMEELFNNFNNRITPQNSKINTKPMKNTQKYIKLHAFQANNGDFNGFVGNLLELKAHLWTCISMVLPQNRCNFMGLNLTNLHENDGKLQDSHRKLCMKEMLIIVHWI